MPATPQTHRRRYAALAVVLVGLTYAVVARVTAWQAAVHADHSPPELAAAAGADSPLEAVPGCGGTPVAGAMDKQAPSTAGVAPEAEPPPPQNLRTADIVLREQGAPEARWEFLPEKVLQAQTFWRQKKQGRLETVETTLRERLLPIGDLGHKGARLAVVNVWAFLCEPCKREMPLLKAFMDKEFAGGREVRFVALHAGASSDGLVPIDHIEQLHNRYAKVLPHDTEFLYEVSGEKGSDIWNFLRKYKVAADSWPFTIILDCNHRVRWIHRGELTQADLDGKLKPALATLLQETANGCPVKGDRVCSGPRETCSPLWPDCNEDCHKDSGCQGFAGENLRSPWFRQCFTSKMNDSDDCKKNYNPSGRAWCANDGVCAKEELAGFKRKTDCGKAGECTEQCNTKFRTTKVDKGPTKDTTRGTL